MTHARDSDSLLRSLAHAAGEPTQALLLALSLIDEAVLASDKDGKVRFMNRQAEQLCGSTLQEADGRDLDSLFQLSDEQHEDLVACTALRGSPGDVVRRNLRWRVPGREERLLRVGAVALPGHDDGCGMVLALRDITEERRAEAARVRLAAIVESSEDAIISKTLEGVIESWNAAAERLFGWTAEEAIGKPITLLIPPELLDEEAFILSRLRSGERLEHFETERLSKDGRRLDISLSISPVKDRDGRIVGVSKIARDVSEQKRSREALREADRRKDEFIALLSHELRNPLAPIGNGLQFLKLQPSNVGEVAQVRDMMERQLRHLVRQVDDLLDVSRIGQNRMQIRRARVTLTEIVDNAVETVRPAIEAGRHELTVSVPSTPVYLDADLTRIAQVLANLLSNAAKYTDAGGRITLTGTEVDGKVVIAISDNGIGIPPEELSSVFQMFAQVERAISRSRGGLGIGLALVQGIVEMHGGSVIAESEGVGKGSTFTVRLPAAPAPVAVHGG